MLKKTCLFLVLILIVSAVSAVAEPDMIRIPGIRGDLAVKSGSDPMGGGWDTQHGAVHEVGAGEKLMLAATLKLESIVDSMFRYSLQQWAGTSPRTRSKSTGSTSCVT